MYAMDKGTYSQSYKGCELSMTQRLNPIVMILYDKELKFNFPSSFSEQKEESDLTGNSHSFN